jgi:hypothetical protein
MINNIYEDVITLSIKEINENLLVISKIKENDKLYHDENKLYIEDSYLPSVQRWYRGSSRTDTIKFIKYILTQTFFQFELLKKRHDDESIFLHNNLLNNLKNANRGLLNLQKTYNDDMEISYQIQKNINYIKKFFA